MAGVPDLGLNISGGHAGFCQALDEAKATSAFGAAADGKSKQEGAAFKRRAPNRQSPQAK